jgi:hypothetical protein
MHSDVAFDANFNSALLYIFEVLRTCDNDVVKNQGFQDRAEKLESMDAIAAWEWRAYADAINDLLEDADAKFERALYLRPDDTNVMVRWLTMLCVTGQVGKVKERFKQFRPTLEANLVAMEEVIPLLGYVGFFHDAFQLRERVAAMGGIPGQDVIGGEFWIGAPPDLGIAKPLAAKKYPDPWPWSAYKFSLADAEEILADQGLSTDAWSEPIGCALRFLRRRGLKVAAVRSSFIPHLDGPSSMHFQLIVQAEPDVCWDAEWEFCGVLVEESFPVIDSGAASIAFIPTLMGSSSANIA